MANEILRKFVIGCETGQLKEEDVASLGPSEMNVQVGWMGHRYSLGITLVNVLRYHQGHLPHWRSLTTLIVRNFQLDVDEGDYVSGWALLHHCARHYQVNFADVLVHHLGAGMNVQTKAGHFTPLHLSAMDNSRSDMLKFLVAVPGVELKQLDKLGKTALDVAKDLGTQECIDLLTAAEKKLEKEMEKEKKKRSGMIERVIHQTLTTLLRLRIFLLGGFGTGKTSLTRALLGEEFEVNADSTEGVRITRSRVRLTPDDQRHRDAQRPLFTDYEGISGVLTRMVASALPRTPAASSALLTSGRAASRFLSRLVGRFRPRPAVPAIPSCISEVAGSDALGGVPPEIVDKLEEARQEGEERYLNNALIDVVDCGGQTPMTIHQSVYLDSTKSIFILTANACEDIDQEISAETFRFNGKSIPYLPLFPGLTPRSYLLMWISLLTLQRLQSKSNTSTASSSTGSSRRVKVFLVPTHVDQVKSDEDFAGIKKKFEQVVAELSQKTDNSDIEIEGPFFVDNRRVADPMAHKLSQMAELQKQLGVAIEEIERQSVPLLHLKLENAISVLVEGVASPDVDADLTTAAGAASHPVSNGRNKVPYMTFGEFGEFYDFVSNGQMSPLDRLDALQAFHKNGVVICRDHCAPRQESMVFLCPQWLLQQFAILLTSPMKAASTSPPEDAIRPTRAALQNDLSALAKRGLASERLVREVWRMHGKQVQDALCDAMCFLDLACRVLPSVEEARHSHLSASSFGKLFIPFCTRQSERVIVMPAMLSKRLPALRLSLPCSLLPPAAFSRLAVHLVAEYKSPEDDFTIGFGALGIQVHHTCYACIQWSPSGLILELSSSNGKDLCSAARRLMKSVQKFCSTLLGDGHVESKLCHSFVCEATPACRENATQISGSNVPSADQRDLRRVSWVPLKESEEQAIADGSQQHSTDEAEFRKCQACDSFAAVPVNFKCWLCSQACFRQTGEDPEQRQLQPQDPLPQQHEIGLPWRHPLVVEIYPTLIDSLPAPEVRCEMFARGCITTRQRTYLQARESVMPVGLLTMKSCWRSWRLGLGTPSERCAQH